MLLTKVRLVCNYADCRSVHNYTEGQSPVGHPDDYRPNLSTQWLLPLKKSRPSSSKLLLEDITWLLHSHKKSRFFMWHIWLDKNYCCYQKKQSKSNMRFVLYKCSCARIIKGCIHMGFIFMISWFNWWNFFSHFFYLKLWMKRQYYPHSSDLCLVFVVDADRQFQSCFGDFFIFSK